MFRSEPEVRYISLYKVYGDSALLALNWYTIKDDCFTRYLGKYAQNEKQENKEERQGKSQRINFRK